MSEAWVVNASPLIPFSRIGRLDLIDHLALAILVPNAVIEEVRAGQDKDRTAATAMAWAEQYRIDDMQLMAHIEHWDLGPGESQVIAHSIGRPRWAVLDDRSALCRGPRNPGHRIAWGRSAFEEESADRSSSPAGQRADSGGDVLDDEFADRALASVGE